MQNELLVLTDVSRMVAKIWEDVCLSWRPLKESFKYVSRTQHYPIRGGDFPTNLYIQIVYTIGKFCTLLKKFVHYTILSEQEWAPWIWYWMVLYHIVLHWIVWYFTVMYNIALYLKVLHFIILYCIVSYGCVMVLSYNLW